MMKKRLRPIRTANQFEAGSTIALATKLVSTHVASSVEADSEPAIYGRATEAIAVSRISMNVASMTAMATIHGLSAREATTGD
jgi:hypothetical protein